SVGLRRYRPGDEHRAVSTIAVLAAQTAISDPRKEHRPYARASSCTARVERRTRPRTGLVAPRPPVHANEWLIRWQIRFRVSRSHRGFAQLAVECGSRSTAADAACDGEFRGARDLLGGADVPAQSTAVIEVRVEHGPHLAARFQQSRGGLDEALRGTLVHVRAEVE